MIRPLLLALVLIVAGLLVVAGASAQPVRIVVLGSSTAAGAGPSVPDSAWVNRYRAHALALDPGHEVVNRALGGYTTYHVLPTGTAVPPGRPAPDPARNVTAALALDPDAIVVNLPSNDVALGYAVAEQLANYDAVVAAAAPVPVWITTSQPRNLSASGRAQLMAVRDSIRARYGDRALDFWTTLARPDGSIEPAYDSGDGIHLNAAGHRILFLRVVAADVIGQVTTAAADQPTSAVLTVSAHPNPFRATTTITFTLPATAPATLDVYDARGRRVARLADGVLPPGTHRLSFDAAGRASGPYLYRLTSGVATRSGVLSLAR